jgi:hypothetical protein
MSTALVASPAQRSSAAIKAALKAARQACGDLDHVLRPLMTNILDDLEFDFLPRRARKRTPRPWILMPDRWKYLNKLTQDSPLRRARAAAYSAIRTLLDTAWPPLTSTQRSRRSRRDPAYRKREQAQKEDRDIEARMQRLDRLFKASPAEIADSRRYVELQQQRRLDAICGPPLTAEEVMVLAYDDARQEAEKRRVISTISAAETAIACARKAGIVLAHRVTDGESARNLPHAISTR